MAGRPITNEKNRLVREAILRALEGKAASAEEALIPMAKTMIEQAEAGDVASFREIADRLDGKPSQQMDLTVSRAPAPELSEDELKRIAASGSAGAVISPPGSKLVS